MEFMSKTYFTHLFTTCLSLVKNGSPLFLK